jgi:hypothetical protein
MTVTVTRACLATGFCALLFSLYGAANDTKTNARQAYDDALANPTDARAIERLKTLLPRAGAYYVVEGDRLISETQFPIYVAQQSASPAPPRSGELLVNSKNGRLDRWCSEARDLTYAVDRASFTTTAKYEAIVSNLAKAARQWEEACPSCQVTFTHRKDQDAAPAPNQLVFVVRGLDAKGVFIAAAFFPSDTPDSRVLQVDPTYFTTRYDPVGVFRHELGHILGYRHEHIRNVPGCYREDNEWKALGPYDPHSVMHYPCGGGGGWTFELSIDDKGNHAAWYGNSEGGESCATGSVTRTPQP